MSGYWITPVTLNYDATRPTGCVASSPDTSDELSFRVSWSRGTDTGGSGLAGIFDIWLKIDNGSWGLLYDNRADTTAVYTGLQGHTYRFEALNIDNANNIEIRSAVAEATTRVDTTYQGYVPGDANGNGQVNGIDIVYLVNYFRGMGPAPVPLLSGDANGNCQVNGLDVVYLVNYFKGVGPAPVRGNCR